MFRAVALLLVAALPARAETPSFVNDVLPILTRAGCNAGSCHGKGVGQNGFRLSLRGYAPDWDHKWLTREFGGRRIAGPVADDSLLLRKVLGLTSHEGGKLFEVEGREHRVLRAWLEAGAPGPKPDDKTATRLEVVPGPRSFRIGDEQQLTVRAEVAPGEWRDVTWLTRFVSNDPAVIDVNSAGRVIARRPGETAVRAAFQGQVAAVVLTVPFDRTVSSDKFSVRHNAIDEHLFNKLATLHIEPSTDCSDAEFVRRVFLDTIGTLPTAEEAKAFVADSAADKRAKLVDALLSRPEFVDYWTLFLDDLLQNRKERDHDVRGPKGVRAFHAWLRQQVADNRGWDAIARDVLTATGNTTEYPAVGYYVVTVGENREVEKSDVADSVAQAFLGVRIGCARCHNHPLEKYTQDDYYHFAAFFSRVKLERGKGTPSGPTSLANGGNDAKENAKPPRVRQPRTGMMMTAQPLDRSAADVKPGDDPRTKLAEWITDPKNEHFAGAMVNRLWQHFFGVGLVEPVDDLRATNPPTNPELWATMTREFTTHDYDFKHMMRLILNSRAYQLSCATTPANAADSRFFSHYYARRLPAEVLADALAQSLGVPDQYPGYSVGVRAIQMPDVGVKSYFLSVFGRPERTTACACERSGEVTVPQLLHLQNGDAIQRRLREPESRVSRLLAAKASDDAVTDELFWTMLGRGPRDAERAAMRKMLAEGDRGEALRDAFWALANTKEFAFNR